jgi:hypothetical protein
MQISGSLLPSRGALFPALQLVGLQPAPIRRAWAAFRYGAWQTDDLLTAWEDYVIGQEQWQEHQYDGYRPKVVDLTALSTCRQGASRRCAWHHRPRGTCQRAEGGGHHRPCACRP